jgi:hypothetical protein
MYNFNNQPERNELNKRLADEPNSYSRISQKALEGFRKDLHDLFPKRIPDYLTSNKVPIDDFKSAIKKADHTYMPYKADSRIARAYSPTPATKESIKPELLSDWNNSELLKPAQSEPKIYSKVNFSTVSSDYQKISHQSQASRKWAFDTKMEGSPITRQSAAEGDAEGYQRPQSTADPPARSSLSMRPRPAAVVKGLETVPKGDANDSVEKVCDGKVQSSSVATKPTIPRLLLPKLPMLPTSQPLLTPPLPNNSFLTRASATHTDTLNCTSKLPHESDCSTLSKIERHLAEKNSDSLEMSLISAAARECKLSLSIVDSEHNPPLKGFESDDSQPNDSLIQIYHASKSKDSAGISQHQYNTFRPTKYETGDSERMTPTSKTQTDWRPPQVPGGQVSQASPKINSSTKLLQNYVSFARDTESIGSENCKTADFNQSDHLETSQFEKGSLASPADRQVESPEKLQSFMIQNTEDKAVKSTQMFEETSTKLQELINLCVSDLIKAQQSGRESSGVQTDRIESVGQTPRSGGMRDQMLGLGMIEPSTERLDQNTGRLSALETLSNLQKQLEIVSKKPSEAKVMQALPSTCQMDDEQVPTTGTSRENNPFAVASNGGLTTTQRGTNTSAADETSYQREDSEDPDFDLRTIRKQLEEILHDSIALEYSEITGMVDEEKKSFNPNTTIEPFELSRNNTPRMKILPDDLTDELPQLSLRKSNNNLVSTKRTETISPYVTERETVIGQTGSVKCKGNQQMTGWIRIEGVGSKESMEQENISSLKNNPDSGRQIFQKEVDDSQPKAQSRARYSDIIERFMSDIIKSEDMDKLNSPRYL